MFVIKNDFTFTWAVDIKVPGDHGKFNTHQVRFTFNSRDQDQINDLLEQGDVPLLVDVVAGWKDGDIQDEDGNAVPYSEDVWRQLIKKPFVRKATVIAYLRANAGLETKN